MAVFKKFDDALKAFRLDGGAMNYHQPSTRESAGWEVAPAETLLERIEGTPLEATRTALAAGGMSELDIAAELADWR